jgi:SAM-dependent methyltransferase
MMWFDNRDTRALFVDFRRETVRGAWGPSSAGRKDVVIDPDQIADFTALPFPSSTFWHVVFDPPHIERTAATGKVSQTFGVLTPGWEDRLRQGFSECFRVLRPGGTLVFKWCEVEIPLSRVLALTPERPLYGHRSGAKARTHWVAFLKQNAPGQARVPASHEAGRSECDWCLRKVGTHVYTNDIGDRFLRRRAHKDGRGNECLHSFAIIEEWPNNSITGGEAVP